MNPKEDKIPETITIESKLAIAIIQAGRETRTGFLMFAPKFAGGSRGEQMVNVSMQFGGLLDELAKKLTEKKEGGSALPKLNPKK